MSYRITIGHIPEDSGAAKIRAGLGVNSPFPEEVIHVDNHDEISSPAAGTSLLLQGLWSYDAPDLNLEVWNEIIKLFLYDVVGQCFWLPPQELVRCWACFCELEEGKGATVLSCTADGEFENPGGKWDGHFYVWVQEQQTKEPFFKDKLMVVQAVEAPEEWKSRFGW
jgi:hypothetical protein